jgi:hypothetical protein
VEVVAVDAVLQAVAVDAVEVTTAPVPEQQLSTKVCALP